MNDKFQLSKGVFKFQFVIKEFVLIIFCYCLAESVLTNIGKIYLFANINLAEIGRVLFFASCFLDFRNVSSLFDENELRVRTAFLETDCVPFITLLDIIPKPNPFNIAISHLTPPLFHAVL